MSITSQDSLYEECLELIESSYSIKSASDESFPGEDEDESLARELLKNLTPPVLSKLRRCFRKNKERSKSQDIDRRVEEVMRLAAAEEGIEFARSAPPPEDTLWLDENGFVTALDKIFGHHKYTTHAHKLFQLLDAFGSGRVWWRQLISKLVTVGARNTSSRAEQWSPLSHISIKKLEHCKRETIVKLVSLEREESFCYVAISRGGRVGVYSGELRLLHSYEMFYHRSGSRGRVKNRWITDAIFLPDVQYLVMSASDRSLTIYDAATLSHTPLFCITGLPNIPTCMAYLPSVSMSDTSELIFGTDRGDITRVKFLQPRLQFMHLNTSDHMNYYFWMELSSPPHTSHCSITCWKRVHSRSVRRVRYSGAWLLSCSHDAVASVRLKHIPGKIDDYVFKVLRGVSCFHSVPALHIVAAGGCDGSVRLWQPGTRAAFATLPTPTNNAILDIVIVAAQEIVIAYCNNCTVHIWDIYEECLLQSIKIKFPFLGVLGKKVEFGTYGIHAGPIRKDVEETASEITGITEIPMSRRASSVYHGSTGGLMLQLTEQLIDKQKLEEETEYIRYSRAELQFTCCDYVCTIAINKIQGDILSPPADNLRARRPSTWDLPDCVNMSDEQVARPIISIQPVPQLLSPSTAEHSQTDLETLLQNAGLQGILEKDFVLMQGMKNDLNRKLAEIEANKHVMLNAVNVGAPYLALKMYEPSQVEPVDEICEQYKKALRLYPGPSVAATPTGSEKSTPRYNRCQKL